MKRWLNCLLFLMISFFVGAQDYNEYEIGLVRTYQIGSESGEIRPGMFSHALMAPTAISFTNNMLYVIDIENDRVNIYDSNFEYKAEINFENSILGGATLLVTEDEYFFAFDTHYAGCANSLGEEVYFVKFRDIIDNYKRNKFYPFKNIVFGWTEDGEIFSIINPSSDQTQNKNNYKNPEETRRLFEAGSDFELPEGLSLDTDCK
jgi:hypothetical protein